MKSWINVTMTDLLAGYRSYSNVSLSIYRTNIIPQSTSLELEAPPEIKLGTTLNIVARLMDFHEEGVEGARIAFVSSDGDEEIGQGITDTRGVVEVQYKPERPGRYRIKAVFTGSEGYQPSESSMELNVQGTSNLPNQALTLAGALSISVWVILFYLARRRSARSRARDGNPGAPRRP